MTNFSLQIVLVSVLAQTPTLETAREHLQTGRYDEALETYEQLEKLDSLQVLQGRVRVLIDTGRYEDALKLIAASRSVNDDMTLVVARARIHLLRGQYETAMNLADSALKTNSDDSQAQLVRAECLTELGRLDEALETWRWFVRYYNRAQPTDAETLTTIIRGAAQYARWKSSSQIFRFLVNTIGPDILKDDEKAWQAHHQVGTLLLEKFNRAQGLPELKRALAINSRALPVHLELARSALESRDYGEAKLRVDRCLKVNPHSAPALNAQFDLHLATNAFADAAKALEASLSQNPHDQRTLARQAILVCLEDGDPPIDRFKSLISLLNSGKPPGLDSATRFDKLVFDVYERNPHPGPFLNRLAAFFDARRRFGHCEICLRAAIETMPQLSAPRTQLGLLLMQTGRTEEAREVLDAAFKADPYHVRVSNMRKVLKVLESYDTLLSEHFVIHFDSKADHVLALQMIDYLESIYDELVAHYGFEPPARTHFEIYNNSGGLGAHQWFSARMVGLPWIQTIGASTGVVVALTSPSATKKKYNWARVVRHEFTHVITLQQTSFNIPHWFTEALAVTTEGIPNPPEWYVLLAERVPRGELWSLDELNGIFARAPSPEDWQFAYCQSRMYAMYIIEQFGEERIVEMLDGYQRGHSTAKVIENVFGVSATQFDAGYRKFLSQFVSRAGLNTKDRKNPLHVRKAARNSDAAIKALEAGAKAAPWDPSWLRVLASVHQENSDETSLKAVLVRLAELDADDAASRRRLFEMALAESDFAAAAKFGRELVQIDSQDESLHRELARAWRELGEDDLAEKHAGYARDLRRQ